MNLRLSCRTLCFFHFLQMPPPTKKARAAHSRAMVVAKASKAKGRKTTQNLEEFQATLHP
jgi:hypothetical protein